MEVRDSGGAWGNGVVAAVEECEEEDDDDATLGTLDQSVASAAGTNSSGTGAALDQSTSFTAAMSPTKRAVAALRGGGLLPRRLSVWVTKEGFEQP